MQVGQQLDELEQKQEVIDVIVDKEKYNQFAYNQVLKKQLHEQQIIKFKLWNKGQLKHGNRVSNHIVDSVETKFITPIKKIYKIPMLNVNANIDPQVKQSIFEH